MIKQISHPLLCWLLFSSLGPTAILAITLTADGNSAAMMDGDTLMASEVTAHCLDTPGWEDSSSYSCAEYASNKWCANGQVINHLYAGYGAEENCCACGKPTPIPAPTGGSPGASQTIGSSPGASQVIAGPPGASQDVVGPPGTSQTIGGSSSNSTSSCGENCNACNGDECTQCKNSKYLSSQGICVTECPPGFNNKGTGVTGRTCELCNGKANRRRSTTCGKCGNGEIMRADSDDCQNIQDTCLESQCNPCKSCLENLRSPLTTCLNGQANCFHHGNQWCPKLMTGLMDCQGVSLGCFYKILCYSPCVCKDWKTINCGGRSGGDDGTCASLLELAHKRNATAQKEMGLMRREQADDDSNALSLQQRALSADLGHQDLDATLDGKCNTR